METETNEVKEVIEQPICNQAVPDNHQCVTGLEGLAVALVICAAILKWG